ncbi:MAG: ATP-binding protein [Clostridia bacterium]
MNKKIINNIKDKILKKEGEKNNIKLYEGFFNEKDFISPTYINLNNPKFLEIDDYFYSGIIIVNYYREYNELILKSLIETNINMNISIFYEKQETAKTIKELTYNIGNVGVELKQSSENRQDIDIAAFTYNDAKYIRKEIQINNENIYFLYIYLNVFAKDKKELEYNLDKIEGILQSKGLQTRRANFRQEQIFISCLPILENHEDLKQVGKRNILTSGLISTYPFLSSSIVEEKGIYIGNNMYNNSLILIDRYNTSKYKNANMCIFGTSGAGKSFYTKLLILRNTLLGIEQYVIDPEKEYNNIAKKLNGTIIKIGPTSENYINIFDIRKESIEENEHGYLATKIGKLIGFFNLIFGELNEEEKAILEEKLIETYKKKNITFNDKTLYKKGKFKITKDMPILEDLYNNLNDEKTKKFKIKLIPFIKGSSKFFNNYTNIELNKKLIIADVYELGEENMKYGMYLFTELFWDKIKINKNKKSNLFR